MIRLVNVQKRFGELLLFDGLNLRAPGGKVSVILGPSGCGKTSLLNMLAGILQPDGGRIEGVGTRRISYLFQEPRLIPWRTIRGNLEFVLLGNDGLTDRLEVRRRAEEALARVGMRDFADAYPAELSGGMRQRAVIARAFAYPGEILLMDEPLQALDLARKLDLVEWFLSLWAETTPTTVFVTHDIQEAMILGDYITVFSAPPARIIKEIENPVPPAERRLEDPRLMSVEAELYRTILEQRR
ncbi:ABC transporter ATP-binding protein [Marispirochaeta aestuarii]|uniref:ABC transporter ATP-binding protein n=1 Tax=Marispirochaeta aestuarii TaxID=1963862 RepID=UPI0029C6E261|nr:ABC transporter ATP-binding protein [Marispirochaeta aestuarii]